MTNIIIDVVDNTYVLSGDIGAIQNKARIKSNFSADFTQDGISISFDHPEKIIITFDDKDEAGKGVVFQNIVDLLEKFNLTPRQTSEAQEFLKNVNQRKLDFKEFSEKARNIRNKHHEGDDFDRFVTIIEKELKRELYPLQLLSAYHLAFAQNACNFSVPGAGKTSIVYAAYAYLKSFQSNDSKHINRLLIISPPAAFQPWTDEYEECFGKTTKIKRLAGIDSKKRKAHYWELSSEAEITLTSYQSAATDIEHIKQYLKRHNDVMVVLDEAHRIKNTDESAKWATAIKSIADDARARVVLTGTPAPNGYEDLWNLYQFIWPHENIIGFSQQYLTTLDNRSEDKDKFIKNISPFFIRIRKSDLHLPPIPENDPIYVPMDNQQTAIYDFIERKYISLLEADSPIGAFKRARLIRLRQCLTNPALLQKPLRDYPESGGTLGIDDREILQAITDYTATPLKFIAVKDLAKKISQKSGAAGKVIVWAYFVENIESLAAYLRSQGIECETLYGATPSDNEAMEDDILTRERIIKKFHDDNCPYKVIIANPFAVGESISLHKACHNAIYLEKDFNATNYMQSKDRIHRYGLNKDDIINYYHLLSENSMDSDIHNRVKEKEERMLDILERDEIPLLAMDMDENDGTDDDDIRAIIKGYHARKSAQTVR